jgi:hypothetical protein
VTRIFSVLFPLAILALPYQRYFIRIKAPCPNGRPCAGFGLSESEEELHV